jgi:hypothetical protein
MGLLGENLERNLRLHKLLTATAMVPRGCSRTPRAGHLSETIYELIRPNGPADVLEIWAYLSSQIGRFVILLPLCIGILYNETWFHFFTKECVTSSTKCRPSDFFSDGSGLRCSPNAKSGADLRAPRLSRAFHWHRYRFAASFTKKTIDRAPLSVPVKTALYRADGRRLSESTMEASDRTHLLLLMSSTPLPFPPHMPPSSSLVTSI